jgi:hypothetical protein
MKRICKKVTIPECTTIRVSSIINPRTANATAAEVFRFSAYNSGYMPFNPQIKESLIQKPP